MFRQCLGTVHFQTSDNLSRGELMFRMVIRPQSQINFVAWFGLNENAEGITTSSAEKKEIPEGAWYKCPNCKTVVSNQDHENNNWVCAMCDHHERIGSDEYFGILFDEGNTEKSP